MLNSIIQQKPATLCFAGFFLFASFVRYVFWLAGVNGRERWTEFGVSKVPNHSRRAIGRYTTGGFDQHILVEALQILDEINSGHGTWYKYIWFWIQFLPSLNSTTFLSPIDFKLVHFTTWKASNLPKIERCASRFFPNKNWSRHLDLNWSCPGNTPISGQMVACFWAVSMSDRFLKCSYHIRSPGGEGLMGGILSKISSLVNFTFP